MYTVTGCTHETPELGGIDPTGAWPGCRIPALTKWCRSDSWCSVRSVVSLKFWASVRSNFKQAIWTSKRGVVWGLKHWWSHLTWPPSMPVYLRSANVVDVWPIVTFYLMMLHVCVASFFKNILSDPATASNTSDAGSQPSQASNLDSGIISCRWFLTTVIFLGYNVYIICIYIYTSINI